MGAAILAGLVLAYRTMGGTATRQIEPGAALRASLTAASDLAAELRRTLAEGAPLGASPAGPVRGGLQALRRRLDATAQQLERIDVATLEEQPAAVHALIAVAVDELGWAVRLCAAPAYASSQGMHDAAGALQTHAAACLRDAAAALEPSAVAEEGEGSR